MRIISKVIIATISAVGIIGIVGTSLAAPDGSQRLRGLEDRVFLVTAELTADPLGFTGLPIGTTFHNCYIFAAVADLDGNNWFETAFPDTKGIWAQDSNGAKTSYVVDAGEVVQWGRVTPARGKGVLQLEADSFVDLIPGGPAELEFLSVGAEIDASEAEINAREIDGCPNFPDFIFPAD